jgi:hypothetical protein
VTNVSKERKSAMTAKKSIIAASLIGALIPTAHAVKGTSFDAMPFWYVRHPIVSLDLAYRYATTDTCTAIREAFLNPQSLSALTSALADDPPPADSSIKAGLAAINSLTAQLNQCSAKLATDDH